MQINKEQLIELLVQKTGLKQEQVEEQLSELITRVQQAAEQGKSFEIEKFGIFSVEEGELRFEPAEEFKTEINNKYAGMEPIEMIGAYEEAEDVEEPEADTDQEGDREDIWGWDGDEEEEEIAAETEESDAVEESTEPGALPESDESEEEKEQPEEEEFKPSFELEESGDAVEEESDEESEEPEEEPREPVTAETKPKTKKQFRTPGHPNRRKKSSSSRIVIIAAAVLIVALAGALAAWFVTADVTVDGSNGSTPGNQQANISTPQNLEQGLRQTDEAGGNIQNQQEDATVASEGGQQSQDNPQNQQSGSEPEPENTVAESEGDQAVPPVYGLKGELNENANDGYTIIVHSLRDEDGARGLYNEFKEQGYRTHIVSAVVNGEEYWRIGIGQFRTVDAADSTAGRLPDPLSNNYFIKRIQ